MTLRRTVRAGATLLGGGSVRAEELDAALGLAPTLICADGGANAALELGRCPDAVLGDLDSLSQAARTAFSDRLIRFPSQETTDFEKCLSQIKASFFVCVGFTGRRLDHELAVLSCVAKNRKQKVVVLGECDVCLRAPRKLVLDLDVGERVSLFPFSLVRGESKGLRWPLDGLELMPNGRLGTSNMTCESRFELTVYMGDLLVILPRSAWPNTMRALGLTILE